MRFWIDQDADASVMGKVFYSNIRIVAEIHTVKPVISNIEDYYVYTYNNATDGYDLDLTSGFDKAVDSNLSFTDSLGNVWDVGDPLPNPGSMYDNGSYNKPVKSMGGLFLESWASELNFSLWDTSNVESMSYMFVQTTTPTLDLSSFDTSNVTDMESMFNGSSSINLNLSSFDTSKVTNMSYMFSDFNWYRSCTLDISNFDIGTSTNVTSMLLNTSSVNPIFVKNQSILDRLVSEGSADSSSLQIK